MFQRTFSKASLPSGQNQSWSQQPDVEIGKIAQDEPTLATMPFIRPDPQNQKGPVKFEWTAVGRDGKEHDFYQVFKPGESEKLPGPTAGRVIMALLSMSPDQTHEAPRIKTHLTELTRLCKLQKGGSSHNRIRKALDRLQNTTIKTNAFWDHESRRYMDEMTMSILSSHSYNKGPHETEVNVQWTSEISGLMNTWTKPINLDHFLSLNSCVARKLYRVSSLGIYQEGRLVEDLKLLCHGHLGIKQSRQYTSVLEQSLEGPIEELREENLLYVTVEEAPEMESGHCVIARPMERMLETTEGIEDPQYWACQLANRGMFDLSKNPTKRCRKTVNENGVERVRNVIHEYDERRSEKSDKTAPRHAGWMKKILDNDISLSPDKPKDLPIVDCQSPTPAEEGGSVEIEEEIASHLQMASPDAYEHIRPKAEAHVNENYSDASGRRRRSLVNRLVGIMYLNQNGPDDLPEYLRSRL